MTDEKLEHIKTLQRSIRSLSEGVTTWENIAS